MNIKTENTDQIYKMISAMNIAFGNKKGLSVVEGKITDYGETRLISQLKNLYDENKELRDKAFIPKVRKEIFDAIADLTVFLVGGNHFIDKPMFDLSVSLEEGDIEFWGYKFDSKEEARYFISNNSFEEIKKQIDPIINSINEKNIEDYIKYSNELYKSLYIIFEIFKKDSLKYDMVYLNRLVNESNLSKLCRNQDEIDQTLHFYRVKNVEVDFKESDLMQNDGTPFLFVYSTKEQFVHDQDVHGNLIYNTDGSPEIKEYRENKFLKNVNWFEPDLTDF